MSQNKWFKGDVCHKIDSLKGCIPLNEWFKEDICHKTDGLKKMCVTKQMV